jgi:hypothetical protein
MPRLCEFYLGICLTTEEKARKTSVRIRKTSVRVRKACHSTVYILPTHTHERERERERYPSETVTI